MSSSSSAKRHNKYYFEDGDVVFLTTDHTLFRLHKFLLKYHSTFFKEMFEFNCLPAGDNSESAIPIDGSSDENPIQLGGHALATLRDEELESVCKVLYDMPGTPLTELNVDAAITLLRVSNKFQFESLHKKAIERLENAPISPLNRYILAVDCLVNPWFTRALVDICLSIDYPVTMDLQEQFARHNDSVPLLKVLKIRESYRAKILAFTYSSAPWPYANPSGDTSAHACKNCLRWLKSNLQGLFNVNNPSATQDVNRDPPATLKSDLTKTITTHSTSICVACYKKKDAIVAQLLCPGDLEKEVTNALA